MTQSKTSLGGLFAFGNKGPPSRRLSWALEGGLRCMSPCRLDLLCAGPAGWSGRTKSIVLNLAISEAPSVGAGDTTATLEQSPERETTAGKTGGIPGHPEILVQREGEGRLSGGVFTETEGIRAGRVCRQREQHLRLGRSQHDNGNVPILGAKVWLELGEVGSGAVWGEQNTRIQISHSWGHLQHSSQWGKGCEDKGLDCRIW